MYTDRTEGVIYVIIKSDFIAASPTPTVSSALVKHFLSNPVHYCLPLGSILLTVTVIMTSIQ